MHGLSIQTATIPTGYMTPHKRGTYSRSALSRTLYGSPSPPALGYTPIAPDGGLSPFSTTSLTWQQHWPLKPDVVFEGGNAAEDALSAVRMPSLSLLTTHHIPADRLLTTANATSAATALASRFAAQVMAEYPNLWPETVRALIVHSAEWTEAMNRMFLPPNGNPSKADYRNLLRRCGFGVPYLGRALWSVSNSLTMVVQETLQPFKKDPASQPTTRDMHLHSLPWPADMLEELEETEVEMRVALSYFIEPNSIATGYSFPLPLRVSRSSFRRQKTCGIDRRIPAAE